MTKLLHYRPWHGTLRSPMWAVWPIARVAFGTLLRRRLFWVLYAVSLFFFLMFLFGNLLLEWATTGATEPVRALLGPLRSRMRELNGGQFTFASFFTNQSSMVMIVLTFAGAILVGNDISHRSVAFYLAKPINRWHYVLGKCLAAGIVVNLLTTLPAFLLFCQHAIEEWDYLVDPDYFIASGNGTGPASWPLLLGILAFGMLLTIFLSILIVTTATWLRRTVPLVMVWTTLFLFLHLLARALVDGLKYDARWRLLDLWNSLCVVGGYFLDFVPNVWPGGDQPNLWEAALSLVFVLAACLIFLNHRTRAVEIIR